MLDGLQQRCCTGACNHGSERLRMCYEPLQPSEQTKDVWRNESKHLRAPCDVRLPVSKRYAATSPGIARSA